MIYKEMYIHLFKRVTMALTFLDGASKTPFTETATKILKDAQCECEEMFMDYDEDEED